MAQRPREITKIQSSDPVLNRLQDHLREILNPFLRRIAEITGIGSVSVTSPITNTGTAEDPVIAHATSGVTAGSYTNASVTVNATGHVTAASSGSAGVTSVGATAPITSSGGTTPTISTSMATDRLLGRDTAGTGVAEELTVGGGLEFTGSGGIQRSALSGDVTAAAGSGSVTVDQARGLRETAGPTTLTMGAVTDGQFLKRSGTTIISAAAGLTNWTEAINTAAPNATIPVASLTATNAAAGVDAAFIAKGVGAILAQVPTNTSAGGNKRGNYATDFQRLRSAGSQSATGYASSILGGERQTASGNYAVSVGGYSNNASGAQAAIGGGNTGIASGDQATVPGGYFCTASATYAFATGSTNTANGDASFATGQQATARGLSGRLSRANGSFSATGDAQMGEHVTRRQTTDATAATVLTADAAAPSSANVNVLPNNHAYAFRCLVVARQSAGAAGTAGDTSAWEITGVIKRGANAASTALVGAVTVTLLGQDAAAAAWVCTAVANTTRGSVEVTVTGEASKTINWVATMWTTEVG